MKFIRAFLYNCCVAVVALMAFFLSMLPALLYGHDDGSILWLLMYIPIAAFWYTVLFWGLDE